MHVYIRSLFATPVTIMLMFKRVSYELKVLMEVYNVLHYTILIYVVNQSVYNACVLSSAV